ncbi:MAG: ABC transporter permease [Defluviitaleaceae bacterium]|nr:ABC transporter permease [Defluviitaleaceae bacterium]
MTAMRENFGNSLLLTRFTLRREKFIALAWILILGLVVIGVVPVLEQVFYDGGATEIGETLDLPAMIFMVGPNFARYHETFGALYTTFMMLFTALTVGIMNIFLVTRYTRADEERGRYEVLRSLPIGRLSNLNAALITAIIVNILLAIVIGLGMFALGDDSMCFHGSMLWGVALGTTGLVFAAIAALFSQLSSNSRGAVGYSFAVLAFFYMLRAPGDMNPDLEIVSLISPLGLVLRTEAYIGNNWWPIVIMLLTAAAISAVAFKFNSMRDIDQGIIPAKPGRAHGSFLMKSPCGLSFKLLRGSLIAWAIGMFMLGASYGSILGGLDEFIASSEMYQQLILGPTVGTEFFEGLSPEEATDMMHEVVRAAGFSIPQLFVSMITNIMGIFVTVPVIIFALRVKSEEKENRADAILATSASRNKYLGGYVVFAFISAIVIQVSQAVGMYAAAAGAMDDISDLPLSFLLEASLVYVPALWVMVGLTVFLIGIAPKATGLVWAYFGIAFLIMFFGRMGVFPDWVGYITPFEFVPQLPADEINFVTMAVLTLIAVALTAAGFFFYNKRDINAITH